MSRALTTVQSWVTPASVEQPHNALNLEYVNASLGSIQTEEDRRVRYTIPRSAGEPVNSLGAAYARMDELSARFEQGELSQIEYEGAANTLLAELEAVQERAR